MSVHRVIDIANAILAGAFVAGVLPASPVGKIAQAAVMVIVSYPALEPLFAPGRYWRFAVGVAAIVALLELTVMRSVNIPAEVTWGILAAAVVGWFVTRRRVPARDTQ
jgi:hypothetical protein